MRHGGRPRRRQAQARADDEGPGGPLGKHPPGHRRPRLVSRGRGRQACRRGDHGRRLCPGRRPLQLGASHVLARHKRLRVPEHVDPGVCGLAVERRDQAVWPSCPGNEVFIFFFLLNGRSFLRPSFDFCSFDSSVVPFKLTFPA